MLPEEIILQLSEDFRDLPRDNLQSVWLRYDETGLLLEERRLADRGLGVAPSDFLLSTMLSAQEPETYAHVVVRSNIDPPRALLWCRDYKMILYYKEEGARVEEPRSFSGRAEDRIGGEESETAQVGHLRPGREWMDDEVRRGFAQGFDILSACLRAQAERGGLDDMLVPFLAIPEHENHRSRAAVVDFSEEAELSFSGAVFNIPLAQDFSMGETLRRYINLLDQAPFSASTIILPAGRGDDEISCYFFSYDRRNSGVGLVRFVLSGEGFSWEPKEIDFYDSQELVEIITSEE